MTIPQNPTRKTHAGIAAGRRAFTLVELLVVVAILVVLAALTFGVSSRVMQSAHNAKCLSNLRNLHALSTAIAQQHNGEIMPRFVGKDRWSTGGNYSWKWYVEQEMGVIEGDVDIMGCDAHRRKAELPPGETLRSTYVINGRLNYNKHACKRYIELVDPGNTFMFADNQQEVLTKRNPLYKMGEGERNGHSEFGIHSGRSNVIFADGHVQAMAPGDFPEGNSRKTLDELGQIFFYGKPL